MPAGTNLQALIDSMSAADTTPTAGTWVTGDRIEHLTFAAGKTGTVCTAGGSPGTWALF